MSAPEIKPIEALALFGDNPQQTIHHDRFRITVSETGVRAEDTENGNLYFSEEMDGCVDDTTNWVGPY